MADPLEALLTAPPRLLPASLLVERLALLDAAVCAYRAELQRRPSHARAPPLMMPAGAPTELELCDLPPELIVRALTLLDARALARCDCVSRAFHTAATPQQPGLVEQALRRRAADAGHAPPAELPEGEQSWVQLLLSCNWMHRVSKPTIGVGEHHTLFVDAERRLLSCGLSGDDRDVGILGHGEEIEIMAVPTAVAALQGVRVSTVAASPCHSLAVTDAGCLYSWGFDYLGHGDREFRHVPTLVAALSAVCVRSVAAGSAHSLAVTKSGALYSWGGGGYGQLGHGDLEEQLLPKRVAALQERRVCSVAASFSHTLAHSLAVTKSGALYSWGSGGYGQLGHGDQEDQLQPKRVAALQEEHVCSVAAGYAHILAVTASGALYSWGGGGYGQLGHGDLGTQLQPKRVAALQEEHVCSVATGSIYSLAITASGALYSWGEASYGQLGHGDHEDQLLPKRVAGLHEGVSGVAAGGARSVAVTKDGKVHGWGGIEHESLGLQLTEDQLTPLEYPALRHALL